MGWMNQNAGAVQAITAIVIVLFTGVLIAVTWWYAKLTRRMALTLEKQLASSFQPHIEMTLADRIRAQRNDGQGNQSEAVSGTITVRNKGNLPLKIVSVSMKLIYDKVAFPVQTTTIDAKSRVIAPGEATQFILMTIDVPPGGSEAPYEQIAQIHCCDLAGVSKHSFSVSSRQKDQLNQSLGFQPI
jgi:hypothetical protein